MIYSFKTYHCERRVIPFPSHSFAHIVYCLSYDLYKNICVPLFFFIITNSNVWQNNIPSPSQDKNVKEAGYLKEDETWREEVSTSISMLPPSTFHLPHGLEFKHLLSECHSSRSRVQSCNCCFTFYLPKRKN